MRIIRELWLCLDCTIAECNGDYSGIEGADRLAAVNAGFDALTAPISPDFDPETYEGIRELSNCGCDVCKCRLAGEMHRFAELGE